MLQKSGEKITERMYKTSAWKAKCPIFKAALLLVLGVKLPKKIGHLAFQVVNNGRFPISTGDRRISEPSTA